MGNEIVNRQVNIFIETGNAQKAYDKLIEKEKRLKEELVKATDPGTVKKLTAELNKLSEPIDRARKKITGELKPSIKEMEQLVKSLANQLRLADDPAAFNRLKVQLNGAKLELQKLRTEAGFLGDNKKGLFGVLGNLAGPLAGIASITAAFGLLRSSIDEALDKEEKIARFESRLRNLGKLDVAQRLTGFAAQLQQQFHFLDDDNIIDEIFTKLITYGKLTEPQIKSLTGVIINFAAQNRISLSESTSVIIKALEGNGKALKEYGINIKDAGTHTERLNLIMTTLAAKVEGAADAFGSTTQGKIRAAQQEFRDLKEEIGTGLLPIINKLLFAVSEGVKGLPAMAKLIKNIFSEGIAGAFAENATPTEHIDQGKIFIDNFVQDFEQKTEGEQKKVLVQQKALLVASRVQYLRASAQHRKDIAEQMKQDQALVDALEESFKRRNVTIGINGGESAGDDEKKIENLFKQFKEKLRQNGEELKAINLSEIQQEITRNQLKYERMQNDLTKALEKQQLTKNQFAELSNETERQRLDEQEQIIDRWAKKVLEDQRKRNEEALKKQKELDDKRLQQGLQQVNANAEFLNNAADLFFRDETAKAKLKLLRAQGAERLKAQKEVLAKEENQEVAALNTQLQKKFITQNEYELKLAELRKKYRDENTQAEVNAVTDALRAIVEIGGFVLDQVSTIDDALNAKDEASIERDRQGTERRKKHYDDLLKNKLISQADYDRNIAGLQNKQEQREKQIAARQFRREQALKLGQAVINGAEAELKAIAMFGPPIPPNILGILATSLVAASTLAELTIISKQKPTFARGGLLPGPRHAEGGLPVINPRSGRKVAEVEGGEAILSRSTVKNNWSIVQQLLDASMNRGGAPIGQRGSYVPINFSSIQSGMNRVRMFATGGVFTDSSGNVVGGSGSSAPGLTPDQFAVLIHALQNVRATVSLRQFEDQQARRNEIQNATSA